MNHSYIVLVNTITIGRIMLAPAFMYAYRIDIRIAIAIFLIATLSDWLDGFLARLLNAQSQIGALLDPIADKIMSWAALIVINQAIHNNILAAASACIILRDVTISVQRIHLYHNKQAIQRRLAVSKIAKIKTGLLFLSQLTLTIHLYCKNTLVYELGSMLLYAASLLTLISFAGYHKQAKGAERKIVRE